MSRMYQVTKEIHFCYGHRLLDYNGKCMHPHGHNARVEIELSTANLDSRGMVVDFGDLQAAIKTWIDREFDHKMILCRRDPLTKALADLGESYYPIDENPTAENIARLIAHTRKNPQTQYVLDLEKLTVSYGGESVPVEMIENRRKSFLAGTWDMMANLEANLPKVREVAAGLPYVSGFSS